MSRKDTMTLKDSIMREEAEFPKTFASYEEKDFGIMFYMDDNKDSFDGNHAFIYPERIINLHTVLDDITEFYISKGIKPTIYHPHLNNYFLNNKDTLKSHGYRVTIVDNHRVMLLSEKNNINIDNRLDIRVLTKWDHRIANDILIPSEEPWEIAPVKNMMNFKGCYVFVGYLENEAVAYTNIHVSPYGNTRFDYIVTAKKYRGKGYAGELLSFVVEYCKHNCLPYCWQWAGPSEHICYNAGFRELFEIPGGYANFQGNI